MPTLPAMKAPVSPAPTTPSPTRARHRLAGSGRITGLDVARAIPQRPSSPAVLMAFSTIAVSGRLCSGTHLELAPCLPLPFV
jgi:hypothetical protein